MTTIYLSSDLPDAKVQAVRALCAELETKDPDFAGADILIERDDCGTWVDSDDELIGASLLNAVQRVIVGE